MENASTKLVPFLCLFFAVISFDSFYFISLQSRYFCVFVSNVKSRSTSEAYLMATLLAK
jgi:hypothetical protein